MKSLVNLEISKNVIKYLYCNGLTVDKYLRFFTYGEETRQARRTRQAELRAHGKRMAILHRKNVDSNGSVNSS